MRNVIACPAPELAAVLDRIRAWARANDWAAATLARKAGLSEVVTRDMTSPEWGPTSRSIRALEGLIPAGWQAGDPVPPPTEGPAVPRAATFPPEAA